MNIIVKSTVLWLNLLNRVNEVKKVYGSKIILQTIFFLENIQKNSLTLIGHKATLLDILIEHGISDVSTSIAFLNKLKTIYDLDVVIKKMEEAIDKYGINQVALILEQAYVRVVDTYYANYGFKKVYFPEGVIPQVEIDLKKSMNVMNIFVDSEFIVDEKNFKSRKSQRIFYTSDFRFSRMSFPSKKDMDYIHLDDEKRIWLTTLIKELTKVSIDQIDFVLDNPNNQIYSLSYQFDYYQTIYTDGEIEDDLDREVNTYYLNQDIVVKEASVLMICDVVQGEVGKVKLIIHPTYFKKYIEQLESSYEKELLDVIYELLEHKKRSSIIKN